MLASIRTFHPSDDEYAAVVALYNELWPDEKHFSVDLWRQNDAEWSDSALHQRFVAEADGVVVGFGSCYEKYWEGEPGTVHIEFHIHPDFARERLDDQLFEVMLSFLRLRQPVPQQMLTQAREDRLSRIDFLVQRGFEPIMRSSSSALVVREFAANRSPELPAQLEDQGIEVHTLAYLRKHDPHWQQKLYDLRWAIIQDVPGVEPPVRPTMAEFEQMILEDPALEDEAWFIACDQTDPDAAGHGRWVGMSNLWVNDAARKRLDAGLTGVLRAYRRRGIATVLKRHTVAYAQEIGAETIVTSNEENNPMVGLNLKLGFKPRAAWITYRRAFT